MEVGEVHWYVAWKTKTVCEICYPDGAPEQGSWEVASRYFVDPNGRHRYRCIDHAPLNDA